MSPELIGGLAAIFLLLVMVATVLVVIRGTRAFVQWRRNRVPKTRAPKTETTMLSRAWPIWIASLVGWVALYFVEQIPGFNADSYIITVANVMSHALMAGATILLALAGIDSGFFPWLVLRKIYEKWAKIYEDWKNNPVEKLDESSTDIASAIVDAAFVLGYLIFLSSLTLMFALLIGGVE